MQICLLNCWRLTAAPETHGRPEGEGEAQTRGAIDLVPSALMGLLRRMVLVTLRNQKAQRAKTGGDRNEEAPKSEEQGNGSDQHVPQCLPVVCAFLQKARPMTKLARAVMAVHSMAENAGAIRTEAKWV
eukprot:3349500-Amphidinium_carterae.1